MTINDLKGGYTVSTPSPLTAATKPKKDLLETATDVGGFLFPGTKQIGESLDKAASNIGNLATGGVEKFNAGLPANTVDVPRLAGGYVAAGASALGTTGAGTSGGILANALKSAGIGAAIGGGSAAAEGKDAAGIAAGAAGGAAIGAGTSAASAGAEQLLKGFNALPQRLIRSATNQSKNEILAGKDISKYVLENKKIGTADQLIKGSQEAIDQADKFINESLASAPDKAVPVRNIIQDITQSINDAGGEVDEAGVRTILTGLAPQVSKTLQKETLTLAEANQLRSQLDKTLGNRAFISAQLPYNKGILMDFTNAVREQVKGLAPAGTRQAFNTLSKEITLRDALIKKATGSSRNQIIGLGDLISGGIGGSLGGIPGIAAGAAIKRAAESTLTKTATAQLVMALDKTLSPVLKGMEPAAQTAVMNALIQAFQQHDQATSQL